MTTEATMARLLRAAFAHLANPVVEFELEKALLKKLSEMLRELLRDQVSAVLAGTTDGATFDVLLESMHEAIFGALMMRLLGEPDFVDMPFSLSQLGRANSDWVDWHRDPGDQSPCPLVVH